MELTGLEMVAEDEYTLDGKDKKERGPWRTLGNTKVLMLGVEWGAGISERMKYQEKESDPRNQRLL